MQDRVPIMAAAVAVASCSVLSDVATAARTEKMTASQAKQRQRQANRHKSTRIIAAIVG